jgi:hypothetical protein
MSTRSFPVAGPINLHCKFGFGSLVVRAEDDLAEAQVTLTAREPDSDVLSRTTVEMRGSSLIVHGPKPRGGLLELPVFGGRNRNRDAMDIEVVVPSGTDLKVATFAADVSVHGRTGNADIASGSTTVELEHVDGDARVRFGSGPVTIGKIRGSAAVRAGSSEVKFGEADGDLDIAFGAGSLQVQTARGAVRMRSGAGSARIGTARADVDLTSGTGELSIGLPAGQQARLDVVTGSGQLHTDMPVETTRTGSGPAITVRARTGSGDVTVSRAAS